MNEQEINEVLKSISEKLSSNSKNIIVKKRKGTKVQFSKAKVKDAIKPAFKRSHVRYTNDIYEEILMNIYKKVAEKLLPFELSNITAPDSCMTIKVETIQDIVEDTLMGSFPQVAKEYILYRKHKEQIRDWVDTKEAFITKYKEASNTANATIDDNSNVSNRNIGILNTEIHKEDNIQISRRMVVRKLRKLFPEMDAKQYERDLANHIIYKHDESSFAGAVAPYCVALTMYPFLDEGIKGIGGLSAKPKNLDSFCGMFVNMIFAISAQFAGAVACPEALLYFDYFARKEWGDDYYLHDNDIVNPRSSHPRTIGEQIHQHFQQIIYSINQPAAARGLQSAFVNFSYYDKAFFDSMFGDFMFPDFTKPQWESLNWLQKDFMQWFNEERLHCILTFPVESFALVYKDGEFLDKENADFVADEYARGHSFFTYISDTVDSLSSCCFEGSEVILIGDEKGNKFFSTIKDFVNSNNSNIDKNGNKNMKKKYYTTSYNLDGKIEKTLITGTLKKKYEGDMYKIYTSENNYITVTPDHILMVKNSEGEIINITAEELVKSPNDYELVVV